MSVIEGSRGATVLVGMPGLVVGAQQVIDGELWLFAESTAELMGCSGCGTRAVGHGRARALVRDLAVSGRPTVLCIRKRRWRCVEADCEVNTWTERLEGIAPRAVLTERARRRIAEMVNCDGDSISAAAAAFGVGWHCANQAVAEFTDPHVADDNRIEQRSGFVGRHFCGHSAGCQFHQQGVEAARHLALHAGDVSVPFRQQTQHPGMVIGTDQRQPRMAQSGDRHRTGIIRIGLLGLPRAQQANPRRHHRRHVNHPLPGRHQLLGHQIAQTPS